MTIWVICREFLPSHILFQKRAGRIVNLMQASLRNNADQEIKRRVSRFAILIVSVNDKMATRTALKNKKKTVQESTDRSFISLKGF